MKHRQLLILVLLLVGVATSCFAVDPYLSFDGVNDYVDCGNGSDLNISTGTVTIEAWVNVAFVPPTTAEKYVMFSNGAATAANAKFTFGISNNKVLLGPNGVTYTLLNASSYIIPNTWQHWAIVYQITPTVNVKFFLDGVEQTLSKTGATMFASEGNTFRIGNRGTGAGNGFFPGKMDEIRFWNVARTGPEILANMNYELNAPFSTNLVAYWKLNGNASSQTAIESIAQNNGTLLPTGYANGPQWGTTYDYPPGTTTLYNGVTINTPVTGLDYAAPVTPPVPNPSFTQTSAFGLTGTGTISFLVFTNAEYGAYYQNGIWHTVAGNGASLSFSNIDFDASNGTVQFITGNGGDPTLPVELSSFTAVLNAHNKVVLTWVTQSETSVMGFYVYRGTDPNLANAQQITALIDATNTSDQQVYVYTDSEINQIGTYYYWLMVADINGSESFHGPIHVTYENTQPGIPNIPVFTELKQVYPNPFNPNTNISYVLAQPSDVLITIFNMRGQEVRSFDSKNVAAGSQKLTWDGKDQNGTSLASGVYYIRMQAGADSFFKKAVLMK